MAICEIITSINDDHFIEYVKKRLVWQKTMTKKRTTALSVICLDILIAHYPVVVPFSNFSYLVLSSDILLSLFRRNAFIYLKISLKNRCSFFSSKFRNWAFSFEGELRLSLFQTHNCYFRKKDFALIVESSCFYAFNNINNCFAYCKYLHQQSAGSCLSV